MSMTHEEAARILDPETRLDALAEIEYYGGFHGKEAVLEAMNDAFRVAVNALRNLQPTCNHIATSRTPLTLEQLRGMDGQPVYCEDSKEWGIIHIDPDGMWANIPFFRGVYCDLDVKHNGLTLYAFPPANIDRDCGKDTNAPTNADRIRAMSDDELAEFLAEEQYRIANVVFQTVGYGLEKQVIYARRLDWLRQTVEED